MGEATPEPAWSAEHVALERALEGLFRLSANKRFDSRQDEAIGVTVTRAGYAALRSLADGGPLSIREVADACVMDAATASRQITQLVEDGLVERRTSSSDARAAELSLTDHGRVVYDRIVAHRLAHLRGALGAWSDTDRATLAALVERLSADLRAAGDPKTDTDATTLTRASGAGR